MFAHLLVDDYQNSKTFSVENTLYFRSYCGGFPKIPNDFRYKFSWSPLGVLKALKSPAQWLDKGKAHTSQAPWEALSDYTVKLPEGLETFQAYPNRDSLPFLQQYGFSENWKVEEFVRGTLRLAGWSTAWQSIFDEIAQMSADNKPADEVEQRLTEISQQLEKQYCYDDAEPDRVVLNVDLMAKQASKVVWHQSYLLDAAGNSQGQAMARLVSLPVSFAAEDILAKTSPVGVSAAAHQAKKIRHWLQQLKQLGEYIRLMTILANSLSLTVNSRANKMKKLIAHSVFLKK